MNSIIEKYFFEVISLLRENALQTKNDLKNAWLKAEKNDDAPEYVFQVGRNFAYYEVISLLQEYSELFGLHLKDLNLDNIDAEKDIVGFNKNSTDI
jgi:hypothetical protein